MKKLHKMKSLAGLGKAKLKNALRCTLLLIGLLVGVNGAWAQTRANEIRMKTGNETITDEVVYNFYDSGGPYIMTPEEDPNNDYNWVTWYQHNESYLLHLVKPAGYDTKGIQITFNYLLINDDHLKIYEGDLENEENLIVDLTCNDFSTAYPQGYKVVSHGNMTLRFESNGQYRDAGWDADVRLWDYTPQPPVALMEACENNIVLLPGSKGTNSTAIYYTTDGSMPTHTSQITNGTLYTAPFAISEVPATVKAILIENDGAYTSSVSTYTFNSLITPPVQPTITRVAGTNNFEIDAHWSNDLRDTYYIHYTTDGTDPQYAPASQQLVCSERGADGTYVNKINTVTMDHPGTLRVVTRGTTCTELFSEEASETVTEVFVPTPEITVSGTGNTGTAQIICSLPGATIYYTLDGTDPTTATTTSGTSPLSVSVPAGTTIKAMAAHTGTGYTQSGIATAIYIPGGSGSGTYGGVVLLDDREDHNMTYYKKAADLPTGYPTAYLSSPDPRNVKITYKGGGVANASAVAISALTDENQNQMVYLKTMEKTVIGMTGNYPYTVISNPFSKRPATGTGNNKVYYGFAGWKVISGGEHIQEYSNDDVLPLDATIHFTDLDNGYTANCLSADVVFEATWTRATVIAQRTAPTFSGGSYETNFWVLTNQNYYNNLGNLDVPENCTMSARYPDGTASYTGNLTGRIQAAGNNAKVEFVNMNSASRVSAEGYTFTVGRGVVNSSNGGTLYGSRNDRTQTNTVKIESGTYSDLRNFGEDISSNRTVNQLMILGCDYDRAKDDNSKLVIRESMYVGEGIQLDRTANSLYVRTYIKSGNFQSTVSTSSGYTGAGGTQTYYYSVANTHNTGRRYLEVEGGHLRGIAGGMDETNAQTNTSRAFDLRVRGKAQIDGVVYGAAEFVNGKGIRNMVFTGGTVKGWIAGGANGTRTTNGAMNGTSYLYIGGTTNVNSTNTNTVMNRAIGGNVFGAGCGYSATSTSGQVTGGTNVVIADNAYVERGVYGGGSYGYTTAAANLYVLGGTVACVAGGVNGTTYSAAITGGVFGGACQNQGGITNITMKDGEVTGNVYGGSNANGTVSGLATINVSGGTVTNVFGGGYGTGTNMANNTIVNVSGGTINNNVYGGGALGTVTGNTSVTVSGGTMQNVFGAGLGSTASTANIGGTTTVNVSGGSIAESVYGGGEIGNVKQATNPSAKDEEGIMADPTAVSTVNITGGNIASNVFGGGRMGFTNGGTIVNMNGGAVEGSVFGGAFGTQGRVYVAGMRVVNMRGGTVNKHVYGGSRNADDALVFNPGTFANSTATGTASVVNYSGGYTHYQVFASGYFGNVFGSTYAFIGTNAILNAPNHVYDNTEANLNFFNAHTALRIGGSVWAGGDFGNYDGTKFGDHTVSGRSNVYIDGTGYDTESNNTTSTNYMYIGGSIYGSGTSCDAGKQGRHIVIQKYGKVIQASQPTAALPYSSATRALYSVQRADSLDIVDSHIVFLGEGKINSLVTTEKYTIHEFQKVRINNGSSIFLNYPADQMKKFGSYKVDNVYNPTPVYNKVTHETSSLEETPNKIRVSNGAFIQIKYVDDQNTVQYGELEGFAYMMSDDANNTCAYARPKQSTESGNIIPPEYDNPDDGGWVSYDKNLNDYTIGGASVPAGSSDQMRYENHTVDLRNGEQYFRIWRAGGTLSYREGVFVAQSDGTTGYSTTDVVISLPAFENESCEEGTAFYRIKSLDGNTTIDYGTDLMTVNAACYGDPDEAQWMYINGDNAQASFVTGQTQSQCSNLHYISEMPNVNFGLVAIPQGGLRGDDNMIICEASDPKIATMQWPNAHNDEMPQVTFRLTYNNNLTNNVVWDPIHITFEQVSCDGVTVLATVDVALTVTTLTNIEQDFVTQAYAVTRGNGSATGSYTAKIVLPQYVMHVNSVGEISKWTCKQVTFEPEEGYGDTLFVHGTDYLNPGDLNQCNNKFGMNLVAGLNFDNTTGWEAYPLTPQDMQGWSNTTYVFGETTARDPIGFDFTLLYDGRQKANGNYKVGTLTFKMHFTNYEEAGEEPFEKDLNIKIEVWFLGQGANYYIDGVHGNNLYSGKFPNAAKQTLSGIFNRTDYKAGDNIFVVNTVTADGSNTLMWNGKAYDEVTLYRYPGGHQCVPNETGAESHYMDYDIENNAAFTGTLVEVKSSMEMTGIVLDGFYFESQKPEGEAAGDIEEGSNQYFHTYVPAVAPLVNIANGGRLSVYGQSRLENNYNSSTDGGGVYIANGGVLNLYDGSAVDTNFVATTKNGGGIYVNSTSKVQLSDLVNITGNQQISSSKASEGVDNNVYLSTYDSHVDIGTVETDDPFNQLLVTSKVGITKNPDWGTYYYAPVAFSDGGQTYLSNLVTDNAPESGAIMWDDQTKYEILSLNNTHLTDPLNYVYFVGTWVTEVTSEPAGFSATEINTPQELAWAISVASGYNGQTAAPNTTFTLTDDIDMSANIWVPIGSNGNAYTGTFNGNGHVVTGLRSPLNSENMGMFGSTTDATITDLVAQANFAGGTMRNVGTVIGSMSGGTLNNVEAAGTLTGTNTTANMGGLVGTASGNAVIHSGFAVNTMTGGNNTVMGGLVGTLGGEEDNANLFNSYSNVVFAEGNPATTVGGLVGVNNGQIENCYNATETSYPFAYTNNGSIKFSYAAEGTENYVNASGTGATLTGHGTYGDVLGRKEIGYMYDDNKVTATNDYVASAITYDNGHNITKWPGLVSTLNQWVAGHSGYTPWFRPTSGDINSDLPVLGFPKDNSMGTVDGKFLRYGSNVNLNGIDALLTAYNDNGEGDSEPTANIFLYGNATDVANVPAANTHVFINEDAVLLQSGNGKFINTTVGVTFDNSSKNAYDYYGNKLEYDWHFMSTPLQNAPINATYGAQSTFGQPVNIQSIDANSYFPNGIPMNTGGEIKWDFYSYYEPEYHWINLKRGSDSHWHMDAPTTPINYTNETNFVPGKGYMMAINQDSYMSSTGTLNNGGVTITLTNQEPLDETYNKGWNLVGNPYQAYLDLNKVGAGNYYIYDAESNAYVPYAVEGSENPVTPSRYIHPHQGFFMHTDTDNTTFTFGTSMATTTTDNGSYFRGDDRINYPLVNLFATNESGNTDLAIVEFNRPEIGGATKVSFMTNANFSIAAHLNGEGYGLLFAPEGTEKVPVHFKAQEDGIYTLTWSTYNGDFSSLLLVDNKTGVITDMLRADKYTFDASADDYSSRFYITYTVTDVDENVDGESNFAYFDGTDWVINGQGTLDVVDVLGRTLFSQRLTNDQNRVNLNGVAKGVYLLRVSNGKNTMVQKIVVR